MLRKAAGRACTLTLQTRQLPYACNTSLSALSSTDDQPSTSGYPCLHGVPSQSVISSFSSSQGFGNQLRHASTSTGGSWWWSRFAPKSVKQQAVEEVDVPVDQHFPLPESSTEAVMAIQQAIEAGDRACIAGAKADAFVTNAWCMDAIQWLHESGGLPWWGAIIAINLTMRMITMPLALLSQKFSSDAVAVNADLIEVKKLHMLARQTVNIQEATRLKQQGNALYSAHQAQHGNPMLRLLKVPAVMFGSFAVFITIFNSVRNLTDSGAYTMVNGGALWFTDLTAPDPYYGLPILCSLTTAAIVRFGMNMEQMQASASSPGQVKLIKWFMYGASAMFIPFGYMVPSGVALLWVSNGWVQVVQGKLVRHPAVRKAFGIPTMEAMKEMNARVKEVQAMETEMQKSGGDKADADRRAAEQRAKDLAGAQLTSGRAAPLPQQPAGMAAGGLAAGSRPPVFLTKQQQKQKRFQ